jgi:hypothetical protein
MALHGPHEREIGGVGLPDYIDITLGIQGDPGGAIAPAPSERRVEEPERRRTRRWE